MSKKRIICFLGPQGSGKGTQATKLSKRLGLPHLSSGELFRSNIEQETSIGLEVKGYLDSGQYVPDTILKQLLEETLEGSMYAGGVILDGVPRTLPQKEVLDSLFSEYEVIYIDIDDDEVVKRLSGRLQCTDGHIYHTEYNPPIEEGVCDIDKLSLTKRADDTPELIEKRLQNFHEKTQPLLDAYKKEGKVHVINGTETIDAVSTQIEKVMQ